MVNITKKNQNPTLQKTKSKQNRQFLEQDIQLLHWLDRDPDPVTKKELQMLIQSGDTDNIKKRFNGRLKFGTAGLRALVGVGTARMNRLVVRESSAGLGRYLNRSVESAQQKGVLVTYDGRIHSRQFAEDVACVFAGLGFIVYFTDRVAPTPVGAFGVTHLGCAAGVVVTASHNPANYNGYKVYWGNGAQIIPPHDIAIADEIDNAVKQEIPWVDFDIAKNKGIIHVLSEEFYNAYYMAIKNSPLFHALPNSGVKIAYSAMHGVGAVMAKQLLQGAGFNQVYSVLSQQEPDGLFPTVSSPNPEEPDAMKAVLALAVEQGAHLACANDPDADRLAVAARTQEGQYRVLTGDEIGILIGAYLLKRSYSYRPIICTTIVSSSLLRKIAEASGALFYETLTGFKWIANLAQNKEDHNHQFLFAYEEALGYSIGRVVKDKDGLSALVAFAQMTAQLATQNKSVFDELERLYRIYGLHLTQQHSIRLPSDVSSIGDILRKVSITAIAGIAITITEDLKNNERYFADGQREQIDLPRSDVLIYRLSDGSRVIIRPSGTEPKIKCYYEVIGEIGVDETYSSARLRVHQQLQVLVKKHQKELCTILNTE